MYLGFCDINLPQRVLSGYVHYLLFETTFVQKRFSLLYLFIILFFLLISFWSLVISFQHFHIDIITDAPSLLHSWHIQIFQNVIFTKYLKKNYIFIQWIFKLNFIIIHFLLPYISVGLLFNILDCIELYTLYYI